MGPMNPGSTMRRLSAGWIQAVDLDALAATAGDDDAHDFIALPHAVDTRRDCRRHRRTANPRFTRPWIRWRMRTAGNRGESRRRRGGGSQRGQIDAGALAEEGFHGLAVPSGEGAGSDRGPGRRLSVTLWLDSESTGVDGMGRVSA